MRWPSALALLVLALSGPARADEPATSEFDSEAALAEVPAANPLAFKAVLEKAEVKLGEPFRMSIEIRHDPAETYALPGALEMKEFGIRSRTSGGRGGSPRVTVLGLELQAFEVGERELPAIRLRVDTPDGLRQLEIPPQKLLVQGIIDPAQTEPKMREDTRPLPTRYRPVWWPWLVLAGLVAVALGIVGWRRLRSRLAAPPPPKPRAAPDVEALERLAALEREGLASSGRKQEHFFRVTEIVRDYLGRRYGFEALELTTDELLETLRRRPTPGLPLDAAETFLRDGDLVKFARREPTDGECKASVDVARRLVEQTRPPAEGRAA